MKLLHLLFAVFFIIEMNAQSPRNIYPLRSWKFINLDIENAELPTLNAETWENVKVPHDWAIDKPFDMNIDVQLVKVIEDGDRIPKIRTGRTGALPFIGIGWYRCAVNIPNTDGKSVNIEFDGAMSNAKVYLNGDYVEEWPYGYSSFCFDLSDSWKDNEENIIAVRLENKTESSRWYPGAGLYRNVRLVVTNQTKIAHWGTYITTPQVRAKSADVLIKTKIENHSTNNKLMLVNDIYDANNNKVATSKSKVDNNEITQNTKIKNPKLWSPEQPNLYKVISSLYEGSTLVDQYQTTLGVRSIAFDRNGFKLNEKPYYIKGVCMHHDLGPLGAAVNYRALLRQMEIMKEMGANAIRTSHNPPTPELLQICDSIGLMVQVEAFDEWKNGKAKNGYNLKFDDWAEKDLVAMIHRDRNHPCVIMWSIGNEIREQTQTDGAKVAQFLADICRREDPTRPTTAGFNTHISAIENGLANAVDLVGFNYKPHDYKRLSEAHPNLLIYGSETASTVSSRGDYKFPVKPTKGAYYDDYKVSSYDLDYAHWASTPDVEWMHQDENKNIFGEFVWTGFDYLGEPTPYNVETPARSSYFGIVDLVGFKKDRFYLYQSRWSDKPVLHLLPHWDWADRIRQNVPVMCYTNYHSAELFVNGKSQGVKIKDPKSSDPYERYRLIWKNVVYQPGEIKVIAYDKAGNKMAEKVIKTSTAAKKIQLTPDKQIIKANEEDLSYITIDICDKEGNLSHRAENTLFVKVEGAGTLEALCNGSQTDHTAFSSNYMRAYNGKLMAIVRSTNKEGDINIIVSGSNLKTGKVTIKSIK